MTQKLGNIIDYIWNNKHIVIMCVVAPIALFLGYDSLFAILIVFGYVLGVEKIHQELWNEQFGVKWKNGKHPLFDNS